MSESEPTTQVRAEVERYLAQTEDELAQAILPRELMRIVAGCQEHIPRLAHVPDLQERIRELVKRARAEFQPFQQVHAEHPLVEHAQDSNASNNAVALRSLRVGQLRELVTRCHTAEQQPYATDKLRTYLGRLTDLALDELGRQLGVADVFIELVIALPIKVASEVDAMRVQIQCLRHYMLPGEAQDMLDDVLGNDQYLSMQVVLALVPEWGGDEGLPLEPGTGLVVRVLLSLRDYWDYYWLAQVLTPEQRDKLFAFGQNHTALLLSADPLPSVAKRALLATMRREPVPEDVYDALESFTYALVNENLISYAQATALVKEVTGRSVSVEAWAKRLTRYADRQHLPRIDGRKLAKDRDARAHTSISLAHLFKNILQ